MYIMTIKVGLGFHYINQVKADTFPKYHILLKDALSYNDYALSIQIAI